MNNNQRVTETISAKLPNFWVGYIIAAILIIIEILVIIFVPSSEEQETFPIVGLIGLGGWVYWLICIYEMHKVLADLTNSAYPISPTAAVGYHFIPFYNIFYWIFKWPAEIAKFVNARLGRKVTSKDTGVFLFLVPFLGRMVDGGIALVVAFSVGHYLSRKILQMIQESKKIALSQATEEGVEALKETSVEKEGSTLADKLMGRVPSKDGRGGSQYRIYLTVAEN
jgi:hypothetical protein